MNNTVVMDTVWPRKPWDGSTLGRRRLYLNLGLRLNPSKNVNSIAAINHDIGAGLCPSIH